MAGLWDRFRAIFGAKVSKALDRAENPNETLDYSYEQQLSLLQNVKRGIADVVTAKKRLQWRAAVDEDSSPTRLVGDEVGVREPARIHAALDEHGR